jgi:hypothetical protein
MLGLAMFAAAALPASAQTTGSKLPVTFDVVAGINVATVTVPIVPPEFQEFGFDFSVGNRVGFVAGVLIGIPVADGVAVETGALISFKGASLDITIPELGTATGSFNLTYLDVPGLGRFRVVTGSHATVHALAGVTMGLKLAAEQSATFMGQTVTEDIEGISDFDLGLTFGRANFTNANTTGSVNLREWSRTPVWKGAEGCVGNLPKSLTGTLNDPAITEGGRRFLAAPRTAPPLDPSFRPAILARRALEADGAPAPARHQQGGRRRLYMVALDAR